MLLFKLLQPAAIQIIQDALLVSTRMGKKPRLFHNLVVADLESSLLLSPDVVAECPVEIWMLALATLDSGIFWLLVSL